MIYFFENHKMKLTAKLLAWIMTKANYSNNNLKTIT